MATDFVLAQLAREPVPGQVKTRLIPDLSPERAASLHAAMVRHIASRLVSLGPLQLWVAGDPGAELFQDCQRLGDVSVHLQPKGDLGARMQHIVEQGLSISAKVILVGSDVPDLDVAYVASALSALEQVDAVIGPAEDGGYVLLGLRRPCAAVFRDMPWGTSEVLARTLAVLEVSEFSVEMLYPLPDIDRPEDLRRLPEGLDW